MSAAPIVDTSEARALLTVARASDQRRAAALLDRSYAVARYEATLAHHARQAARWSLILAAEVAEVAA